MHGQAKGAIAAGHPLTVAAAEDDPAFIRVGGGYYDINDNSDAGEFHFEYLSNSLDLLTC